MAITLVTGQPGHGKTQWAIAQARKLVKDGRTVYAGNIRGLKYAEAGFVQLDAFDQWESLPDGSVVLWDECYDALPQRAAGRKVPDHVEALARHRHRGFDFILVCQQPKQLDSFVSGLIERHVHARRKWGTQVVALKEWDRWERDTDKAIPLVTKTWRLDRSIWPLYESATQHTMQRRVPWYVYGLPLAIIAVVGAFLAVPGLMISRAGDIEEQAGKGGATSSGDAAAALLGGASPAYTPRTKPTRDDIVGLMQPRIPGAPWSARAYDDLDFAPPPRLACMSSETTCRCLTIDQGTIWTVEERICRVIARNGMYDPTYQPQRRDWTPPPAPPVMPPAPQPVPVVRASRGPYVGDNYRSPDVRVSGT